MWLTDQCEEITGTPQLPDLYKQMESTCLLSDQVNKSGYDVVYPKNQPVLSTVGSMSSLALRSLRV